MAKNFGSKKYTVTWSGDRPITILGFGELKKNESKIVDFETAVNLYNTDGFTVTNPDFIKSDKPVKEEKIEDKYIEDEDKDKE